MPVIHDVMLLKNDAILSSYVARRIEVENCIKARCRYNDRSVCDEVADDRSMSYIDAMTANMQSKSD